MLSTFHNRQAPAKKNPWQINPPVEWGIRKCYPNPAAVQPLDRAHCHPCSIWKETCYLFQSASHQPTKRHPRLLLGLDSANHLSPFQKRCDHEIFWPYQRCTLTLFVVCLTAAWEMARQKFPDTCLGTTFSRTFLGQAKRPNEQQHFSVELLNSVSLVH